jgi:hypothetical protein
VTEDFVSAFREEATGSVNDNINTVILSQTFIPSVLKSRYVRRNVRHRHAPKIPLLHSSLFFLCTE